MPEIPNLIEPGAPEYVTVRFKRSITCYEQDTSRNDKSMFAILQEMSQGHTVSAEARAYAMSRDHNIDTAIDKVMWFRVTKCNNGQGPVRADATVLCERAFDVSKLSPDARAFFEAWRLHGKERERLMSQIYCSFNIKLDDCKSVWTTAELVNEANSADEGIAP